MSESEPPDADVILTLARALFETQCICVGRDQFRAAGDLLRYLEAHGVHVELAK